MLIRLPPLHSPDTLLTIPIAPRSIPHMYMRCLQNPIPTRKNPGQNILLAIIIITRGPGGRDGRRVHGDAIVAAVIAVLWIVARLPLAGLGRRGGDFVEGSDEEGAQGGERAED